MESTDTPAETQNPSHGQPRPARSGLPFARRSSVSVRESVTKSVDRLRAHGHTRRTPHPAAGTSPPTPKRLPFAHHLFVYSWFSFVDGFPPQTRPPKPTTRRTDKPTQPEATPICTSSIREFVVFIRGRLSPTDTPAETHNPPQGQPRRVRKTSFHVLRREFIPLICSGKQLLQQRAWRNPILKSVTKNEIPLPTYIGDDKMLMSI